MSNDPLALFAADRSRARDAGDPMAHLCTIATVDTAGSPQLRTLVLRDVDGELAIFVNATSPKWPALIEGCAVLTYWPSVQVQYRLQVRTEPVPGNLVAESWQLRPDPPKRMDWYYTRVAGQSSPVENRSRLILQLDQLSLPEPLTAPDTARGLVLKPMEVERLDLTQANGIHDRVRYTRKQGAWQNTTLVP